MGCEESFSDMNSAENKSDYIVTQVFPQENRVQVEDSEPPLLKSMAKLPPASLGARVSPQSLGWKTELCVDAAHKINERKASKQC